MKADEVARYLRENPGFFEDYADVLAEIYLPHPHGGRAIPLSDRQVLTLREKNKTLEARLSEMLRFGEENDAIQEKLHRLCIALLAAKDLPALIASLYYNLREDFAVPHVALRLWRGGGSGKEFSPVTPEMKQHAAALAQPFCGPSHLPEAAGWFVDTALHVRSVAHMGLKDSECFGLLALGSEDVLRFYPEMGTLYLKRLGEMVAAAIAQFL